MIEANNNVANYFSRPARSADAVGANSTIPDASKDVIDKRVAHARAAAATDVVEISREAAARAQAAENAKAGANSEMNRYFNAVDTDGSGSITKREYMSWLEGQRPEGMSDRQFSQVLGKMDEVFDRAAQGGSEIAKSDFMGGVGDITRRFDGLVAAAQGDSLVGSAERAQSGQVGVTATGSVAAENADRAVRPDDSNALMTRFFNAVDSDGSGAINEKEFASWLERTSSGDMSEKQTSYLQDNMMRLFNKGVGENGEISKRDFMSSNIGANIERYASFIGGESGNTAPATSAAGAAADATNAGYTALFDAVQPDENGYITESDFVAWLQNVRPDSQDPQINQLKRDALAQFKDALSRVDNSGLAESNQPANSISLAQVRMLEIFNSNGSA